MRHKIVLTGGPGSGKTKSLEMLKREDFLCDFIFFEELARKMLSDPKIDNSDRAELHQKIYFNQVERENQVIDKSFITDRGTIDAFAFHPETISAVGTNIETEYNRYTQVFQLGSSAALGDEYYKTDDIRNETVDEALHIENNLCDVWRDHPNYQFIQAYQDFEKKYEELIKLLTKLL